MKVTILNNKKGDSQLGLLKRQKNKNFILSLFFTLL